MPEPEALPDVRDLTDEEYAQTYADGTGGHPLPPDVLAKLEEEASDDGN